MDWDASPEFSSLPLCICFGFFGGARFGSEIFPSGRVFGESPPRSFIKLVYSVRKYHTKKLKLLATDLLALASMKNAAKCDT